MKKEERMFSYPAIVTYEKGKEITIDFPDLKVATSATCKQDVIPLARELLAVVIKGMIEDGEEIPIATPIQNVHLEKNEKVILIDFIRKI